MQRYVYLDAGHGGIWQDFYIATSGRHVPGFVNSSLPGKGINDPGSPYYIPQDQRETFQFETGRWFYRYQGNIIAHGSAGTVSSFFQNVQEQALTFKMAGELQAALGNPYYVLLTRPYAGFVHLQKRWSLANTYYRAAVGNNTPLRRQHVFVSLHCNSHPAGDPRTGIDQGFEIYTRTASDPLSSSLAGKIADAIKQHFVTDGVPFNKAELTQRNFRVLRHTKMPAVLIETAWLDNQQDTGRLVDAVRRTQFISAIRDGIDAYFGYQRQPGDDKVLLDGYVTDQTAPTKTLGSIQVFAELGGLTRVVRTDAKGHFQLQLPKTGTWKLTFSDSSGRYRTQQLDALVLGFNQRLNNTKLQRKPNIVVPPIITPPADANVSGVVEDQQGNPLSGVSIDFTRDTTGQSAGAAVSNARGEYRFKIEIADGYSIQYSKTGYQTATIDKSLNPQTQFRLPKRALKKLP